MKVLISKLRANPYRDVKNYPIDKVKVEALKNSIEQTGFWDNILGRLVPDDGTIEIAYGHHRLQALRELYPEGIEVDIPIKELPDATMLKIMANENMDDWKATPQVIDETVRVTKRFLEDHPEEVGGSMEPGSKRSISAFLSWPESRVSFSLERLKLIEDDKVDVEVFKELPTERAARNFVDNVKKYDIPKERQKAVVENYKARGGGEIGMREAAMAETFTPKVHASKRNDENVIRIEAVFADMDARAEDLRDGLNRLAKVCQELGGVPQHWTGINWKVRLTETLEATKKTIDLFTNKL